MTWKNDSSSILRVQTDLRNNLKSLIIVNIDSKFKFFLLQKKCVLNESLSISRNSNVMCYIYYNKMWSLIFKCM